MYTKDQYEKRYYELLELTGCKDKAGLILSMEHNDWTIDKLEKLDTALKRIHLSVVPDERGE